LYLCGSKREEMTKTGNYTWLTRLMCLFMAIHILNISFDDDDVAFSHFVEKQTKGNVIETMVEALCVCLFDLHFPDNNLDRGDSISAHHVDLIFEAYELTLNPYILLHPRPYDTREEKPVEGLVELNLPPPEIA